MSISTECQRILHQITTIEHEVKQALQKLEAANPGETINLLQQYRAVTKKLHAHQDSLADCVADSYQLKVSLRGTITIRGEGQDSSDILYLFLLNKARTVITLASFPPISLTISGLNYTITETSGGSGTYANGKIVLPLGLHLSSNFQLNDADLSLTLTTDPPGSPVNPTTFGPVTLVGSGIFHGGMLNGKTGVLTVAGTMSVVEGKQS